MSSDFVIDENFPCHGDHFQVVLIVGYEGDTFIVRTSWGADFADEGYIKVRSPSRIKGTGTCDIMTRSFFPVVRYANFTL